MRISHPLHRRRSGGLRRGYAEGMPIPAMAVHSQPLPLPDLLPTVSAELLRGHVLQQGRFQIEHGRPGCLTSHQMGGAGLQPAGPWAGLGTGAFHVKPSGMTLTILNRAEHVSEQLDRDAEPVG